MVALHSAYHDATPLVMLVGQVERQDFGRLALQEQNYSRAAGRYHQAGDRRERTGHGSEAIARAFHMAESGTPGPVAVILPEDMFDEADRRTRRPAAPAAARRGDRRAIWIGCSDMLGKAERPLVLVGGALLADAVADPQAFADLNRLAEEWVLPISPAHRRPQLFDARHPNYGGYMGIRVPPR